MHHDNDPTTSRNTDGAAEEEYILRGWRFIEAHDSDSAEEVGLLLARAGIWSPYEGLSLMTVEWFSDSPTGDVSGPNWSYAPCNERTDRITRAAGRSGGDNHVTDRRSLAFCDEVTYLRYSYDRDRDGSVKGWRLTCQQDLQRAVKTHGAIPDAPHIDPASAWLVAPPESSNGAADCMSTDADGWLWVPADAGNLEILLNLRVLRKDDAESGDCEAAGL